MVEMYPHSIVDVVVLVDPIIVVGVGRWRYL